MTNTADINRIIARAKTQRAETIATGVEAYAVPAVLVVGLSLLLLQFSSTPPADTIERGAPVAQVTTIER